MNRHDIFTGERPLSNDERHRMWVGRRYRHRLFTGVKEDVERLSKQLFGARHETIDTEPEPDTLLWVTAFASIALTLGVLTSHVIWSVEDTKPVKPTDCGYRWTEDARYVQHMNYRDGQGCVEVRDE